MSRFLLSFSVCGFLLRFSASEASRAGQDNVSCWWGIECCRHWRQPGSCALVSRRRCCRRISQHARIYKARERHCLILVGFVCRSWPARKAPRADPGDSVTCFAEGWKPADSVRDTQISPFRLALIRAQSLQTLNGW